MIPSKTDLSVDALDGKIELRTNSGNLIVAQQFVLICRLESLKGLNIEVENGTRRFKSGQVLSGGTFSCL